MDYDDFRTGYTFTEIRRMLALEQKRKRRGFEYMFVTRKTVLGRWHQLKQEMYQQYKDGDNGKCF